MSTEQPCFIFDSRLGIQIRTADFYKSPSIFTHPFLHVLTTGKGSLNQACRLFYYLKI